MPVKIGKISGGKYKVSAKASLTKTSTKITSLPKKTNEFQVHDDRVLGAGPGNQGQVSVPRPILVERVAPNKHRPG